MAIIHIITAIEPNPRTDISAGLEKALRGRGHDVLVRPHDEVDSQTIGTGLAEEGDTPIAKPHIVIIDGTVESKNALASAASYHKHTDRILMLTTNSAADTFADNCGDVGALPVYITKAGDTAISAVTKAATNLLRIGDGADTGAQLVLPLLDNEKNQLGMLDLQTNTLTGPNGSVHLPQQEATFLRIFIESRGTLRSKEALLQAACKRQDDQKTPDVIVCKLRKKFGEVGFNSEAGPDGMIATIWGSGYMFRPDCMLPKVPALEGPSRAVPKQADQRPADDVS